MSTLSRKVLALIAAGASASTIAYQFLGEKEGVRYRAYLDSSGIPTICRGHTEGVKLGDVATPEQCEQYFNEDVRQAEIIVDKLVKVKMSTPQRVALISFCAYNIGQGKCQSSTFLRKLNSGDKAGACAEIRRWIFDRGEDCRIQANNCYGQVIRREQEQELCSM